MIVNLTENVLIDVVRYEATSSVAVSTELGEDLIDRNLATDGDAKLSYNANGGSGNGPEAGGDKLDIFTHRAGIILKNRHFFTQGSKMV